MTAIPTNAIAGLPELSWRALSAPPYDDVSFSFSHQQAERRYPYIDGAGHDWVGRNPLAITTKLYFLNALRPSMFPNYWDEWRAILFDGESGELRHPILGKLRARVVDGDVEFTARRRDGVICNVRFTETLDDPSTAVKFADTTADLAALAAACDLNLAADEINWPDGERSTSLTELIGAIEGLALSAQLTMAGMINQALGTVARLIRLCDTYNDAAKWATRDSLVQLWTGLYDLAEQAGDVANAAGLRPIGYYTTVGTVTLDWLARELSNTVAELLELNIHLLAAPAVPEGTKVLYYTA